MGTGVEGVPKTLVLKAPGSERPSVEANTRPRQSWLLLPNGRRQTGPGGQRLRLVTSMGLQRGRLAPAPPGP